MKEKEKEKEKENGNNFLETARIFFGTKDEASSLAHPPPLKYAPSSHEKLPENTLKDSKIWQDTHPGNPQGLSVLST